MGSKAGEVYKDDENQLVLELFMNLDYSQFKPENSDIVALSEFLREYGYDCSPGSIKAKLENLKSVNPEYTKDGRKGLSKICTFLRQAWAYYEPRGFETLSMDAEAARMRISGGEWSAQSSVLDDDSGIVDVLIDFPEGKEKEVLLKVRTNQSVFRRRVLASFGNRCCITGMTGDKLLIASHIKPWAACVGDCAWQRTDPSNGLCLNALHDRAFDRGIITLDDSCRVEL